MAGLPKEDAYGVALELRQRGMIFVDWSESDLEVFVSIDEDQAWPEIRALVGRRQDSKIQNLFPHLGPARRTELLFDLVEQGVEYHWYYAWILDAILKDESGPKVKAALLTALERRIFDHTGKFDERGRLLKKVRNALNDVHSGGKHDPSVRATKKSE